MIEAQTSSFRSASSNLYSMLKTKFYNQHGKLLNDSFSDYYTPSKQLYYFQRCWHLIIFLYLPHLLQIRTFIVGFVQKISIFLDEHSICRFTSSGEYNQVGLVIRAEIKYPMTAKQSQLYIYFQNKAHHYQNIQTARPKVQDRLDPAIHHTMDCASKLYCNRDFPQNKRYEIQVENGHRTHRIASIQSTSRKEVEADGNYSRYNRFERKFRLSKWAQSQEEKLREIKNQKIQAKIASMKTQVGSRQFWEHDYIQKTSLKKQIKSSRGSLHLQQTPFMPQAYLDFLNMIHSHKNNRNNKDMTNSKSSKGDKQTIAIQKLFILPNLTIKRQQKMKNRRATLSNPGTSLHQNQQVTPQK